MIEINLSPPDPARERKRQYMRAYRATYAARFAHQPIPEFKGAFLRFVWITDTCWLWQGSIKPNGYGSTRIRGVTDNAHRLSWRIFHGEIPDGQCVCHRCDTPACVNPDHLFLDTQDGNLADMRAKGRGSLPPRMHGENHPRTKFSDEQVRQIRESTAPVREICAQFGISEAQAYKIRNGTQRRST